MARHRLRALFVHLHYPKFMSLSNIKDTFDLSYQLSSPNEKDTVIII